MLPCEYNSNATNVWFFSNSMITKAVKCWEFSRLWAIWAFLYEKMFVKGTPMLDNVSFASKMTLQKSYDSKSLPTRSELGVDTYYALMLWHIIVKFNEVAAMEFRKKKKLHTALIKFSVTAFFIALH